MLFLCSSLVYVLKVKNAASVMSAAVRPENTTLHLPMIMPNAKVRDAVSKRMQIENGQSALKGFPKDLFFYSSGI